MDFDYLQQKGSGTRQKNDFNVELMLTPTSLLNVSEAKNGINIFSASEADSLPSEAALRNIFGECPRLILELWTEWRYSPPVVQALADANHRRRKSWEWLSSTVLWFYWWLIKSVWHKKKIIVYLLLLFTLVIIICELPKKRTTHRIVEPPVKSFEDSPFLWPASVGEIMYTYPEDDLDEDTLISVIEQKEGMKKGLHIFLHVGITTPRINPKVIRERFDDLNYRLKSQPRSTASKIVDEKVDSNGRTLVIYNYVQNDLAQKNVEFFFRHHNPEWADVLLIVNGNMLNFTPPDYVMIWKRPNIGLEVCAHFRVWPYLLNGHNPEHVDFPKKLRDKVYTFFMLLNASVRGPFFPSYWSGKMESLSSWVELFKQPLVQNTDVGLVGTSFNCMRGIPYLTHLQSFALMTHLAGLELMYKDLVAREHILQMVGKTICEPRIDHMQKIITVQTFEIGASQSFLSRNIRIWSILTAWQEVNTLDDEAVFQLCLNQDDQMLPNRYNLKNIHPLEMIFHKTNSADIRTDMELVEMFTIWFDQRIQHYSWSSKEILESESVPRHTPETSFKDVGQPVNVGKADFSIIDYILVRDFP